jgi:hypothetical protein
MLLNLSDKLNYKFPRVRPILIIQTRQFSFLNHHFDLSEEIEQLAEVLSVFLRRF